MTHFLIDCRVKLVSGLIDTGDGYLFGAARLDLGSVCEAPSEHPCRRKLQTVEADQHAVVPET